VAVAVFIFRQDRHKCLGKSPFGKQAPQQIGDLEGDEKGVGHRPGAKSTRDHGVADESKDAGEQGHAADRSKGFE